MVASFEFQFRWCFRRSCCSSISGPADLACRALATGCSGPSDTHPPDGCTCGVPISAPAGPGSPSGAAASPATSRLTRSLAPAPENRNASGLGLERLDQRGEDLVHVAHDPEVGHREDRRLLVLVHGDDVLR